MIARGFFGRYEKRVIRQAWMIGVVGMILNVSSLCYLFANAEGRAWNDIHSWAENSPLTHQEIEVNRPYPMVIDQKIARRALLGAVQQKPVLYVLPDEEAKSYFFYTDVMTMNHPMPVWVKKEKSGRVMVRFARNSEDCEFELKS